MDRLPPFDKIGALPVPDHQNADPASSNPGSIVNALIFNQLQREGVNLELLAGLTPDSANLFQWTQAVSRGGIWVDELTGTGDLAVATLDAVLPAFLRGMRLGGVAAAPNTITTPKLRVMNLSSTGAYVDFPILKEDGSALGVGDIKAGRRYRFEADGAGNVVITGAGLSAPSVVAQSPVGRGLFSKQAAGSYTWKVPSVAAGDPYDVFWVLGTCVGAGAGGSGTSTSGTQAGAGGGGGGAAFGWIPVTPGQNIPYVVGGASLGVGYAGNSGNGGTSSISSIMQATGGRGVSNNGNAGGAGGVGTGGQVNIAGGCGNDAPVGTANYPGGFGGSSLLGGGGRTGVIGVAGVAPGTGGGGGYTTTYTQAGGNGADGYVSFQY
ncbi:hypothetical protein QO001_000857 [Methylobacterium brachiatum]|uniref:Uncharacterized protein n=1 Tax=Methylobacterium brachiatum TaxID=269660 RepID=A0AAJ1WSS6_9HYPH|nr:hypothetical protein [Methylobacterium brachiatum]MCB4803512.1 hypothetical protein [Methylobacterium brachiatum]MDQ0541949.1 hypothetical protein [Methylobacterium brachiatum]